MQCGMTDKYTISYPTTSYFLHPVSSHVCLYNLQPLYSKHSNSSYFSQTSLLTTVFALLVLKTSLLNKNVTCCLHPAGSCIKLQSKETYGIRTTDNNM